MRRGRTRSKENRQTSWKDSAINRILHEYKRKAIKREIEWAIDKELFKKLIESNCHYCKSAPSNKLHRKERNHPPYFYSGLDRLDNLKGYTADNVVPCCARCNKLKSDQLTAEQARVAIRALLRYNARTGQVWVKPQSSRRK